MKYTQYIEWTPIGSGNSVKTAYTTITPELAKEILSNNFENNRNVKKKCSQQICTGYEKRKMGSARSRADNNLRYR